ncbi:hypothetical protein XH99_12975 [Bradyrhizobium nanningense]|uniref:Uncharacterized protein n=1 Tax=Bradyrhizobium nanningense TaxID=1325118 RepID=A0A4Q0S7I1_9BRAD|nr:hypothetical protein XH99_12975 [Bradyrhizobium nanningense]
MSGKSRGLGLAVAIELVAIEGFIARGMPHGDILGFAPPMIVSEAEIDEIVELAYRATSKSWTSLQKKSGAIEDVFQDAAADPARSRARI